MKERPDFRRISWDVTEKEYRQDPAYSYSMLAKYDREGFDKLSSLRDKVESPSLTFGSMVDSLVTGGDKEFEERFLVTDLPELSDSLEVIAKTLFGSFHGSCLTLDEIPDSVIAEVGQQNGYYAGKKWASLRVKKIREGCTEYYAKLFLANGKEIVSREDHEAALRCVEALRSSSSTGMFFKEDNPFDNSIERFYQLKFKSSVEGIPVRCMADLLFVNHDEKLVIPVDLKTSHNPEWRFYRSFVEWRYHIQAELYWHVIRDCMDKDVFYRDYKLDDYRFAVVNRDTLTPLTWVWPYSSDKQERTFNEGKVTLRSWVDILKELDIYLKSNARTPIGITQQNNIEDWLERRFA